MSHDRFVDHVRCTELEPEYQDNQRMRSSQKNLLVQHFDQQEVCFLFSKLHVEQELLRHFCERKRKQT